MRIHSQRRFTGGSYWQMAMRHKFNIAAGGGVTPID
jgi:hypothetical protein